MLLLRLQNKHVMKALFEGNERLIHPQRHAIWVTKHPDLIDPRVKAMMDIAGFRHLLSFIDILINHLVTTLVERWRFETHTFYLPLEETTITLEDVALELGLPIDGEAVSRVTSGELVSACQSLLGVAPPENVVLGNTIKLSWLNNTF